MNHREKLEAYAVVSIASACEILGGDEEPVSAGTVYRLCREGALDKCGKGKVTTASLNAYLAGERTPRAAAPAPMASTSRRPAPAPSAPPDWQHLVRFPKGAAPSDLPKGKQKRAR